MKDREYPVTVGQEFFRMHIVKAKSQKEARAIVADLITARLDADDPRIIESYSTGTVGEERITMVGRCIQ